MNTPNSKRPLKKAIRLTPELTERVLRLHGERLSQGQIASRLHMPIGKVGRILRKAGVRCEKLGDPYKDTVRFHGFANEEDGAIRYYRCPDCGNRTRRPCLSCWLERSELDRKLGADLDYSDDPDRHLNLPEECMETYLRIKARYDARSLTGDD